MKKKLYKTIVNALIFVAYSYFMPGIIVNYGAFGHLIAGLGYGIIYGSIKSVIRFFKLADTILLRVIAGLILISGYLFLLTSQVTNFITITKSYIGNTDFILFTVPRLVTLDNPVAFIIASAIILFVCSIIIEKLKSK